MGIFRKILGIFLILLIVLSSVLVPNNVLAEDEPEDNSEGVELTYEVVENDNDRILEKLKKVYKEEPISGTRAANVRVSIVLEDYSTLDHGFSSEEAYLNPDAISYRESLKIKQDDIASTISKEVLNGNKLDIVWNLTLAANIISANVPSKSIEDIKNIPGVKDVFIETEYFPDNFTIEENDPNMSTASEMTATQYVWAAGYTGAGRTVAIVDTGLDLDHQSFSSKAFDFAIQEIESDTGEEVELLRKKDISRFWSSLNASKHSSDYSQAYKNTKIPYGFNYVDGDFDVSHLNDAQGEHGSHVASIAAGNKYIYTKGEDGSISLKNALKEVFSQGNAPDAQILVMKVFGKGGGAYDSDYFAAIEDAIILGADSVNLSLGSGSAGFTNNTTYKDIIDGLTNVNVVWANSAGNNGYWATQTKNNYLYADDANFATGGSPATYPSSLSVASVDNKGFTGNYLEYNDDLLFYSEPKGFSNEPIVNIAGEHEFIYIDAFGTEEDFAKVADLLEGKIAICSRGTTSFYQKATAAVNSGAIATIIVNNQVGTISMDLTDYKKTEPCVSITLADGNKIKESAEESEVEGLKYWSGSIVVSDQIATDVSDSDYYAMSSFSSFGVPGDLSLKPEITAPGGNIYAVYGLNVNKNGVLVGGHDQYENMSGTSMASPQIAGITAVLSQYIKENGLDTKADELGITRRALMHSLLMSTANPLMEQDSNSYYSILNQGSGLVDVEAAMNSSIVVLMEETSVNGENKKDISSYAKDGKVKAELGDDPSRSGKYSISFTLNNITDENRYFELDGSFFTQDVFERNKVELLDTWTTSLEPSLTWYVNGELYVDEDINYDFNDDHDGIYDDKDASALLDYVTGARETIGDLQYADLDNDGSITTYDAYLALQLANQAEALVPANGTSHIRVDIDMNGEADLFDVNGAYIEGYLFAKEKVSNDGAFGVVHSIPVLGYYGSWSEASVFDKGSMVEYDYELENRDPYMSVSNALGDDAKGNKAQSFIGDITDLNASFFLGGNPLGPNFDNNTYYEDRNAFNSNNTLLGAQYSLIRNVSGLKYELVDEDDNVLKEKEIISDYYAAYYRASDGEWKNTSYSSNFSYKPTEAKEGERYKLNLSGATEYYSNDGNIDWSEIDPDMSLGFVIDNSAPEVEHIFAKRIIKESTVVNEETGEEEKVVNNSIIVTITASDNEYIAGAFVYDENEKLIFVEGSRSDAKKGELDNEDYAFVVDGSDISDHLALELWDYAANVTTVQINLNKDELEDPVEIYINEQDVASVVGSNVKLTTTIHPWGLADQEVLWTSSDEEIATVNDHGVVTGLKEGTVTITATAHADPSKSDTTTVTFVYVDRTLKGFVWDENGEVWLSQFNTTNLPNYDKLSPSLRVNLTSTAYGSHGELYVASFDADKYLSTLYLMDEDTYELTEIGPSRIGYMDMAPAPSLGDNKLLGVYGTYIVIIDATTGDYTGVFNMSSYTGGKNLVGLAYEEQYDHPTYGKTDWYFFIDTNGVLYNTGFLPYNGSISRFNVNTIGSFGYKVDISYYQSLYFDGTDLYWSRFNNADDEVNIIFVNDFYDDGSIFDLGYFDKHVWPVSGLYNDDLKDLYDINSHEDALIDEAGIMEFDVEKPEGYGLTIEKGTTNSINTESLNNVVGNIDKNNTEANIKEDNDDRSVVITITAEDATLHNGLYEVTYDGNLLKLQSVKSDQSYQSFNTNSEGKVIFGFIDLDGVDKDKVLATLTFSKDNKEETTITVATKELNNDFDEKDEEFVIDGVILVDKLEVYPQELTLAKGKSYTLQTTISPEDATNKELSFESSDPSTVRVDENGKITALKDGEVYITVKTTDGSDLEVVVKVTVPLPNIDIRYRTHVQSYGWLPYTTNGSMSGTTGKSKRMEAINIQLMDTTGYDLGIKYSTHIQSIGWQSWKYDGEMSGTTGKSKRLEAIKIELTGSDADKYDVYYRVHSQSYGWMGWAKNGAIAGTTGLSKRLEAIQIVIVPKGSPTPEKTYRGYVQKTAKAYIKK